jgi:hypothetical protein
VNTALKETLAALQHSTNAPPITAAHDTPEE